ncbi:hypothetical protein JB92DRAFT_3006023 [Gautieria morchelliformis]|nr:hypothetical protein JB92DRAFT_3006023 [Gautieria morchelliformis]
MSIATNFEAEVWRYRMVISPETFAGDDLLRIEVANFEISTQERQRLKARFSQSIELTLQSGNIMPTTAFPETM